MMFVRRKRKEKQLLNEMQGMLELVKKQREILER